MTDFQGRTVWTVKLPEGTRGYSSKRLSESVTSWSCRGKPLSREASICFDASGARTSSHPPWLMRTLTPKGLPPQRQSVYEMQNHSSKIFQVYRMHFFSRPARWGSLDFSKGATPTSPPPSSSPSSIPLGRIVVFISSDSSGCSGSRVDPNSC